MSRTYRFAGGLFLATAVIVLAGCDVPNLAPDESDQVDPGIWNGKPIKTWILESKDEATRDSAKAYLDQVGPADKDLVPALIPLLKDQDPAVRRGAARLLGQIGPNAKDALEALGDAAVDPDRDKSVLKEVITASRRITTVKP
jgi:hypothetical protein